MTSYGANLHDEVIRTIVAFVQQLPHKTPSNSARWNRPQLNSTRGAGSSGFWLDSDFPSIRRRRRQQTRGPVKERQSVLATRKLWPLFRL
jgi:hypothetical protein